MADLAVDRWWCRLQISVRTFETSNIFLDDLYVHCCVFLLYKGGSIFVRTCSTPQKEQISEEHGIELPSHLAQGFSTQDVAINVSCHLMPRD
jgi:hypothetical protein